MALTQGEDKISEGSQFASIDTVRDSGISDHPLTLPDMTTIATDAKNTFFLTMTDLKADLLALTIKIATTEKADSKRDRAITCLESATASHSAHLIAINRHLEDLDNRDRRSNVRVRGVPSTLTNFPQHCNQSLTTCWKGLWNLPSNFFRLTGH